MSKYKLSKNLRVTDAYGKHYYNFNIEVMEKRADKVGYNLFEALITRVDSQDHWLDKVHALNDILNEIVFEEGHGQPCIA